MQRDRVSRSGLWPKLSWSEIVVGSMGVVGALSQFPAIWPEVSFTTLAGRVAFGLFMVAATAVALFLRHTETHAGKAESDRQRADDKRGDMERHDELRTTNQALTGQVATVTEQLATMTVQFNKLLEHLPEYSAFLQAEARKALPSIGPLAEQDRMSHAIDAVAASAVRTAVGAFVPTTLELSGRVIAPMAIARRQLTVEPIIESNDKLRDFAKNPPATAGALSAKADEFERFAALADDYGTQHLANVARMNFQREQDQRSAVIAQVQAINQPDQLLIVDESLQKEPEG